MHPCGCKGLNQLWIYLATAKVAVKHSLVMLRNLGCIRLESTTIIRTNTCFLVAQKDVLCLSNISEQIARLWCAWTTLVSDTGSNSSCRHREDKKKHNAAPACLGSENRNKRRYRCSAQKRWNQSTFCKKTNGFCWRKPKPCLPAKKTSKNSLSHWVKAPSLRPPSVAWVPAPVRPIQSHWVRKLNLQS